MQQRRPDEDERFLRTTLRAVPGHPPGGARSHNENSVPGEQTRTLVHSDSGFTKGWFGVQPERKRTSATAPAIRTTTTDTKQINRERNPQAHNSKHQPRLVPWKVRKETLRKPVDNRSSFSDSHPPTLRSGTRPASWAWGTGLSRGRRSWARTPIDSLRLSPLRSSVLRVLTILGNVSGSGYLSDTLENLTSELRRQIRRLRASTVVVDRLAAGEGDLEGGCFWDHGRQHGSGVKRAKLLLVAGLPDLG